MTALWIVLVIVGSYLIGSIPFGYLAGKLIKGVDIREHGSRSIGATNAARVLGRHYFPIVLFLDASKGFGCCVGGLLLSRYLLNPPEADLALFAGLGALLGHFFSVFLKFKGGKGVATGLGVVLVLSPMPGDWLPLTAFCALGVFFVVVLLTRMISAGSIAAGPSLPVFYAIWLGDAVTEAPSLGRLAFFCLIALFLVVKHRSNIRRIIKGEESRIGKAGKAVSE